MRNGETERQKKINGKIERLRNGKKGDREMERLRDKATERLQNWETKRQRI